MYLTKNVFFFLPSHVSKDINFCNDIRTCQWTQEDEGKLSLSERKLWALLFPWLESVQLMTGWV